MESEFLFTIAYFVFFLCFVLSPREFETAGLTVQSLFSSYLGSEDFDFVRYHIKRTTVTLVVHSIIPLGYFTGLCFIPQNGSIADVTGQKVSTILLLFSISIAFCGILVGLFWSRNNWKYHPLTKALAKYGGTWMSVAAQINIEFRRVDKFSANVCGPKIYVTNSWILKANTYTINIAQHADTHLSISGSDHFAISPETNQPTQFIDINVHSMNPAAESFILRLNAINYRELQDRISAPIQNARNIVIHQSLSEKFLEVFKGQIENNVRYALSNDTLEPCIGCMQMPANIKLQKNCNILGEGQCKNCFCRPMWCIDCMGKWFASRQDQDNPSLWMSSQSPCPTCRSKFCMLDICLIEQ